MDEGGVSMGISTHVLDTASGRPASGVGVRLERLQTPEWVGVGKGATDVDGRCKGLAEVLEVGVYRLRFETGEYFARTGVAGLYPWVEIVFEVRDAGGHYHVPLLLTANGYTTYRGS